MEEAQRRGGWQRETWLSQGMSQHHQHPETRTILKNESLLTLGNTFTELEIMQSSRVKAKGEEGSRG